MRLRNPFTGKCFPLYYKKDRAFEFPDNCFVEFFIGLKNIYLKLESAEISYEDWKELAFQHWKSISPEYADWLFPNLDK